LGADDGFPDEPPPEPPPDPPPDPPPLGDLPPELFGDELFLAELGLAALHEPDYDPLDPLPIDDFPPDDEQLELFFGFMVVFFGAFV